MILTLLIYLVIGIITILCFFLPTWNPIPDEFVGWVSQAFALVRGMDWWLPTDHLFRALLVSFAIDAILLIWWVVAWILRKLPFWK